MNSGNVFQTWKALWRSVCYIPIDTRTSYASSQWKLILHHPKHSLHPSIPNPGASCKSRIASHGFLSCSLSWCGHSIVPLILTMQSKCPFFHTQAAGCHHSSSAVSTFLLFHVWHTLFFMPGSQCCNPALTRPRSQLYPVMTVLCVFLLPSTLYYVSPEIQYPHLPPCQLKDPILTHQQLFCTPFTM